VPDVRLLCLHVLVSAPVYHALRLAPWLSR
jgi:hypothetical protein